jgi:hypothetical protein
MDDGQPPAAAFLRAILGKRTYATLSPAVMGRRASGEVERPAPGGGLRLRGWRGAGMVMHRPAEMVARKAC